MKTGIYSWFYLCIIASTCFFVPAWPHPNEGRKFAVKPNSPKKAVEYSNRIGTGDLQGGMPSHPSPRPSEVQKEESFNWAKILTLGLQFVYNLLNPPAVDKIGEGPSLQDGDFSWTKLLSVVLRVALAGLGADNKIDKNDGGPSSPLESMLTAAMSIFMGVKDPSEVAVVAKQAGELINLVVTLLDALKTSFSQRALEARSLGMPYSDAAIAGISLLKGYARTFRTGDDLCTQRVMCEANRECVTDSLNGGYPFCQLGSYLVSWALDRQTRIPFEAYTDAARRGRSLEECQKVYACDNQI
jgi:hypothetical protein